jgi:hypothetical protein
VLSFDGVITMLAPIAVPANANAAQMENRNLIDYLATDVVLNLGEKAERRRAAAR